MRKLLYIIFLIMIAGSACRESFEVTPNTYSTLLTGENSKTWKLIGIQLREEGKEVYTWDFSNVEGDCGLDDLFIFHADQGRTFIIDEGASKCNPDDSQTLLQDSWSLVNATATLEFVIPIFGFYKFPWTIRELTDRRMVVEIFFGDEFSESYRVVFKKISEK